MIRCMTNYDSVMTKYDWEWEMISNDKLRNRELKAGA